MSKKKLAAKDYAIHFGEGWHRRVVDPAKAPVLAVVSDVGAVPNAFKEKVRCGKPEEPGPTAIGPLSLGAPFCTAGCWS